MKFRYIARISFQHISTKSRCDASFLAELPEKRTVLRSLHAILAHGWRPFFSRPSSMHCEIFRYITGHRLPMYRGSWGIGLIGLIGIRGWLKPGFLGWTQTIALKDKHDKHDKHVTSQEILALVYYLFGVSNMPPLDILIRLAHWEWWART